MDKSGTSDPYVKFKQGGRLLFKSKIVHKELNPTFDETFSVPIEDPFQPINIKVRRKGRCDYGSTFFLSSH
jgi:Ca2+-dependent lipid-binding protein